MTSRTPPLLAPYLALPPETSLILLTSVLSCTTNWLVLRFLHCNLHSGVPEIEDDAQPKVVLVSFLRDLAFWKEGSRKLGLDLDKLAAKRRFAFVDGLGGLFLPGTGTKHPGPSDATVLRSPKLSSVRESITETVLALKDGQVGSGKVVLVIDQLDLLLATCGDKIDAVRLGEMVLDLREDVHSMILSLSADAPLVTAQNTPLETNHAAFLVSVAHQADLIMSLRMLDTGTARDVSGVIRITAADRDKVEDEMTVESRDLLYFVGGDGGVRVFERGQ